MATVSRARRFVLGLLLVASGCPGSMPVADQRLADRGGEGGRPTEQRQPRGDTLAKVDLPVKAGVPCLSGACGPNLICMANVCMTMCTQTSAHCYDKVAACTASESCRYASSFTDCCYPAVAKLNEPCDEKQVVYCGQGMLCVSVDGAAPRCLALCKYTCPPGTVCRSTSTGCQVCL